MANKSDNRGKGHKDMNTVAYETVLIAAGQKAKPEPPKRKQSGLSLRQSAKKPKTADC